MQSNITFQCPIPFGNAFRYAFWATEPGTQFYHSHAGHHKVNGHYGALVVRQPNDPHGSLYDFDVKQHTLLVSDWMHDDGEMFMPGLPTRGPGITAINALINGRGQYNSPTNGSFSPTNTPFEVFKVQPGFRYRFRFINSASHVCPVQLQVSHNQIKFPKTTYTPAYFVVKLKNSIIQDLKLQTVEIWS